jgi:hypothetical protein
MRTAVICGVVALIAASGHGAEPKRIIRPITEAAAVIAVYYEDWGLACDLKTMACSPMRSSISRTGHPTRSSMPC